MNAAIENNTSSVTFFSIAATEIVSGVSGDSEKKIRQLFRAAKAAAPSIVFIDEIDAICPKRESAQREMERRIVAQFLASIDDLNANDIEDDEEEDEEEEEVEKQLFFFLYSEFSMQNQVQFEYTAASRCVGAMMGEYHGSLKQHQIFLTTYE